MLFAVHKLSTRSCLAPTAQHLSYLNFSQQAAGQADSSSASQHHIPVSPNRNHFISQNSLENEHCLHPSIHPSERAAAAVTTLSSHQIIVEKNVEESEVVRECVFPLQMIQCKFGIHICFANKQKFRLLRVTHFRLPNRQIQTLLCLKVSQSVPVQHSTLFDR